MKQKIGVSVIIAKNEDDKAYVLLGKRKGSHAAGCWAFPGGHIEDNESVVECAIREVKEETNLDIHHVGHFLFSEEYYPDIDQTYITLFVGSDLKEDSDNLQLMEPNKCEEWRWVDVDKGDPEVTPLMITFKNLRECCNRLGLWYPFNSLDHS